MAEKTGYPQIPSRVWWGVRDLINRNPSMRFEDSNLAATLDVQPTAARQYLAELKRIGLLNDEGAPTDLGKKWRLDDEYEEVASSILEAAYPASLVSIAPVGNAERAMVEKWFMNDGLGSGTAKNKAGTYVMIANDRPGEARPRSAPAQPRRDEKPPRRKDNGKASVEKREPERKGAREAPTMPLNVNVQIHISAEATSEQIETIFSSMRRNLYDFGADSER